MIDPLELCSDLDRLAIWLDQGWRIEQPILQRTVLNRTGSGHYLFEVILRLNGDWKVLALSDDHTVRAWLHVSRMDVLQI